MLPRYRIPLIAAVSLVAGGFATWAACATGTGGLFFRSPLYPWLFAAVLLGGVGLGATVAVRTAVAVLVPFCAPQLLAAAWGGLTAGAAERRLWTLGLLPATVLMLFSVGCVATGVCVRLMFRR
ncbi:hypothetical protein Sru01_06160 [Sphaerisporangium rufum]|uniref:Uncharacterized protein n=1 Tax=Sphaerisporangium rufum TaxID=1381558 RepID=A0A919QWZ6_9ACTN|nr:hypothetical protein [Sphaerisporangium rufum]GII75634.1 hypothetical protein Sru01_06160 [Sphaerisporangium rufum]